MGESPYLYFEPDRAAKLQNISLLARQAVEGFTQRTVAGVVFLNEIFEPEFLAWL